MPPWTEEKRQAGFLKTPCEICFECFLRDLSAVNPISSLWAVRSTVRWLFHCGITPLIPINADSLSLPRRGRTRQVLNANVSDERFPSIVKSPIWDLTVPACDHLAV